MDRIVCLYLEDFRVGADWLHEKLDGKVRVPERLAVWLVGSLSALIPLGIMILIHIGQGGTLWA